MLPPEDTILWRVQTLERTVTRLEDKKADEDDLKTLADEVHGLRRALVLFSLSMIGTAFAFLVGVLAIVAH